MTMPERIWALPGTYGGVATPMVVAFAVSKEGASVEYIRADLHAATLAALREALAPFAEAFEKALISGRPPFEFCGADDYERAAALARIKDLEEKE